MALGEFRPGHHDMTWKTNAVGLTTSDGFTVRWRPSKRKINNTSLYGDSLIDGIYRGFGSVQLIVTFKEWNTHIRDIIWPYGTLGIPGIVGRLDSDQAGAIVLTPQVGSPAATVGPASFTAEKAILSDQNDVSMLFGPVETDMPVIFDLMMYDDSGTEKFFSMPQPS